MMRPLDGDEAWLDGCPARLRASLLRCARGETPPNVALMQLWAEAAEPSEVEAALIHARRALRTDAAAAARLGETLALAESYARGCSTVKSILNSVDHKATAASPESAITHWAATFDRAAKLSPEGSVALYSLGDPDLLRVATQEVVETMRAWGLLGPDRTVLDLGCGIGRFLKALAPEVGRAVGIDISRVMIATARERCAGLPNVRILQSSGQDLSPFADASFDLVLAVDSFPYLVQSGMVLVEKHFEEVARVLRPRGQCLILNFSYRGNLDADRADVANLAGKAGFSTLREGARDFSLWDGVTFHLAKSAERVVATPAGSPAPHRL